MALNASDALPIRRAMWVPMGPAPKSLLYRRYVPPAGHLRSIYQGVIGGRQRGWL